MVARVWPDVDAVVIGASAGGVEALLALVRALPPAFPVPVLVVLHRPTRSGGGATLASLLTRQSALPVADALDRQPLTPGQVVLAPPDYHLLVDPGPVAALSVDTPVLWSRPAIDPLFESAAAVFGARLLALLLTGGSADGSAGAEAVRRHGGELLVQDPAEAQVPTMPQAALQRSGADRVCTIDDMCRALAAVHTRRHE
jgi:two-component system chemotaxis response regulator CheB